MGNKAVVVGTNFSSIKKHKDRSQLEHDNPIARAPQEGNDCVCKATLVVAATIGRPGASKDFKRHEASASDTIVFLSLAQYHRPVPDHNAQCASSLTSISGDSIQLYKGPAPIRRNCTSALEKGLNLSLLLTTPLEGAHHVRCIARTLVADTLPTRGY